MIEPVLLATAQNAVLGLKKQAKKNNEEQWILMYLGFIIKLLKFKTKTTEKVLVCGITDTNIKKNC